MALYDYQCKKCGETFEVRQKFSDSPLTTHDGCGGEVVRLLSAPALQFKGTGWYVTDYGRGGKTAPASGPKTENKSESKSDSKSDSKSEPAKTEGKSESKSEPAKSSSEK